MKKIIGYVVLIMIIMAMCIAIVNKNLIGMIASVICIVCAIKFLKKAKN